MCNLYTFVCDYLLYNSSSFKILIFLVLKQDLKNTLTQYFRYITIRVYKYSIFGMIWTIFWVFNAVFSIVKCGIQIYAYLRWENYRYLCRKNTNVKIINYAELSKIDASKDQMKIDEDWDFWITLIIKMKQADLILVATKSI